MPRNGLEDGKWKDVWLNRWLNKQVVTIPIKFCMRSFLYVKNCEYDDRIKL